MATTDQWLKLFEPLERDGTGTTQPWLEVRNYAQLEIRQMSRRDQMLYGRSDIAEYVDVDARIVKYS